ncbi:histidine permease [Desmophyllum pertusum]|uniref:Histidine permease n=1 Tax=Desmophyllum pertusum TaxID=174260 RepID=A0A9W9ZTX5_9CNID|nr:histidine permease [Desmophyllum pertusum]
MPLPTQVIMCWKAMLLIHKLLREGHPNALKESLKYKQMLKDMKEFWKHSNKGGYGWLIHTYLAVLIAKLDFHNKNDSVPGTLRNSDGGPLVYSGTDVNDYFELSVDIFDYMDTLVDLEKRIYSTLDPFRANSQLQAVQCRICPFPVIIQECGGLYDIVVDIMYKLHARLPADTLTGHRERFYSHFAELKKFFFDAGNMGYVRALVPIPVLPQNPPSFTLSDPKPTLARSTSDEGPLRKLAPTEDLKRQSLMEPLTVPMTTEPLVYATPQTPEADILGINSTDGPAPDNRDLIIYQLRQEIAGLKLTLERQEKHAKAVEDSLRSQITRLAEELDEYKTIAEKACEENVLLRKDLDSKEDDKKEQKGPAEEKFNKLKGMYGKLREEHIQLLRTNAEVKQKLSASEKDKEDLSQVNERLQQEVDDKSTELLQVFQKAEMAEQDGKRAGSDEIERLTNEHDEKISSLRAELKALKTEKNETAEARKLAEEQIETIRKDHKEKIVALSSDLSHVHKSRTDEEEAKRTAQETIERERKEHEDKILSLAAELEAQKKEKDETAQARKTAEETNRSNEKRSRRKALSSDLSDVHKSRKDEEEAKRAAQETIERERKEHEENVTELERKRHEDIRKEKQDLVGMAIGTAERTIQDSLDQFHNPKHSSTTCTADYLLSRIESLPGVVDELNSKFASYKQDHKDAIPCACCFGSFSHQLSECILNAKATSHMAPTQEAADLQSLSESAGMASLELLQLYKQNDPDLNALADKVNVVKKYITDITKVAEALAPKEKDSVASIGSEVDDEINATAELVADSAARIEEMINKTREKYSGVQLEVNGRILDSCTALMEVIYH